MHSRLLILVPFLAACGALQTPDLGHGDVAGRVIGAVPGAFAYPVGAPGLKVPLSADGRFRLSGLPAGPTSLVLFDGDARAEAVDLQVLGAEVATVERTASNMPLAGRLVMTVVPEGGVPPVAPRYQVRGTDQVGVAQADGSAVLYPLPAGAWELDADMDGYQSTTEGVTVDAGTTGGVEVRLQVATSGAPGCAANGDACRNGLRCDQSDGRCYQCRPDRNDCGPGTTCDPATRFCTVAPSGSISPVCAVCLDDASCGGDAAGAYCEKAVGATSGYCSRRGNCPAGFALDTSDPQAPRCIALLGCHAYFEEFGEQCLSGKGCDEHAGLSGGVCLGADPTHGVPGICTAPCTRDADCIVDGFTCDPVALACVRTH